MNGHDDHGGRNDAERDAVKRALRDYRAAAEALDERPSAHARAAILAAAAREAGARPLDAAAVGTRSRRGRSALRWPMAAAATVLLSSLAVMMASRVEQEPQVVTEAASPPAVPAAPSAEATTGAREPAAVAPPPAADAAVEKPAAAPPIAAPRSAAPSVRRRPPSEAPAPAASMADGSQGPGAAQGEPQAPAPAASVAPPAAPTAGPSIAQPAGRAATADGATAAKPESRFMTRELPRQQARGEAAPAADPRADAARAVEAEEHALSANDWLARIVRLREAGRHTEADAQLQRFRQRYPQVKVPEQALPPAGTR